ncbi:4-aminobutyrate aminotransferase-like enzyme [Streptomyces auratus]
MPTTDTHDTHGAPHPGSATQLHMSLAETATAHNYQPLPVVLASGQGAWVTDVDGHRYLDCLAGYSALNFGHGHPRLTAAAQEQLARLTLTSRAFHNDRLGPFCRDLAELAGMDLVLAMNTGNRGRRDRDQGRPPMGLRPQGRRPRRRQRAEVLARPAD